MAARSVTASKSNAERQRAFRARLRADGLTEVRGVFARPEHHDRVKRYAARLEAEREKSQQLARKD